MNRFALTIAAAAAVPLFASSIASADIMVGSVGDAWRSFPESINNYSNVNRPYWDQLSRDGAHPDAGTNANIGNYLMGPFTSSVTGAVASPAITPSWWGNAGASTSNFDLQEHFNRDPLTSAPVTLTMLLESTNNAGSNIIGWYDADNPTDRTVIWSGSASPTNNAEVTFSPTANWGIYIIGSKGTYFMDASLNSADKTNQHFAVFQANNTPGSELYYVGIEDLPTGTAPPENNGDYNDVIFSIRVLGGGSSVPEPTSLGLLGAGAGGLLLRRRKR